MTVQKVQGGAEGADTPTFFSRTHTGNKGKDHLHTLDTPKHPQHPTRACQSAVRNLWLANRRIRMVGRVC
jgi:hypothetical protein